MTKEKSIISVELQDLLITERKDDRCGKVISAGSLTEDDLINLAVARRTDINAATMRAVLALLNDVAVDSLAAGNSVSFGLGHFRLDVKGVFIGDHAKWDPTQHSLVVHVSPSARVRNAVKELSVNVRGKASVGVVINSITDVATGEVNQRLTPGGGVNMQGSKMKIVGDDPSVGIHLISQDSQTTVTVPMNSILINDPSKISFIVPSDLSAGDYKLMVTTQFSTGGVILNEPRSYLLDYVLNCD
jgi:hypothetical protein